MWLAEYTTTDKLYWGKGREAGIAEENRRIVNLLKQVKEEWRKPVAFNYYRELDRLIALIESPKEG